MKERITRQEMDEIVSRATYDREVGCWDMPDAYYDYEVYTFIDAVYDECKDISEEEDFDDYVNYCIDTFNDYDVGNVDFLNVYYLWQRKRPDIISGQGVNSLQNDTVIINKIRKEINNGRKEK